MKVRVYRDIRYTLKRHKRARQVKISMSVLRGIVVTIPPYVLLRDVEAFIVEKYEWILVQWVSMQDAPARSWGSYPAYKGRALKHVRDLVQEWNALYGFEYHQIRVKDMHTQWGSCSSDRRLNFNYRLYFLPKHLADYIVVHELCHLAEMNHSHKFWRLVAQQIPDYKKRRQELKRILL